MVKFNIEFDDFIKLDLCIGMIVVVEKMLKVNKFLKFIVDIGSEKWIVVFGIVKFFKFEDLFG